VAYKKDVDDVRESPALELIRLLRARGAQVRYHDPYVPVIPEVRKGAPRLKSVKLTARTLKEADCVLIATAHSGIDYQWVVDNSQLVVDTRNATAGVRRNRQRIVRA
jgi:UDP-N-acetyl-D-glucosamine dehydrogenase